MTFGNSQSQTTGSPQGTSDMHQLNSNDEESAVRSEVNTIQPSDRGGSRGSGESRQSKEDLLSNRKDPKFTWYLARTAVIAALGGWIFGYETSMIAGIILMDDFEKRFGMVEIVDEASSFSVSPIRAGLIVSVLSIGTLIGSLITGSLCDRFGRRTTIFLAALFVLVGAIFEITSCVGNEWVQFVVGRAVSGLGVGGLSVSCPLYLAEIAPKNFRGHVMYSYQFFLCTAQFVAYLVCFLTNLTVKGTRAEWMITVGLQFIPAAALASCIFSLSESPRYDYRRGLVDRAKATLIKIYGSAYPKPCIDEEIRQISKETSSGTTEATWLECLTKSRIRRRILIGMALGGGQQLTGANFFLYFGTTIFSKLGLENSYATALIFGAANIVGAIIGCWTVHACGRRKPIIFGSILLAICLSLYAFVGGIAKHNKAVGYVLVAVTALAILIYAATWGILTWLMGGELYPSSYRSKGMAVATSTNWLCNFVISFCSLRITQKIGNWYGLIFAVSMIVLAGIMQRYLLESKDLSLERITDMYDRGLTPKQQRIEIMALTAASQGTNV